MKTRERHILDSSCSASGRPPAGNGPANRLCLRFAAVVIAGVAGVLLADSAVAVRPSAEFQQLVHGSNAILAGAATATPDSTAPAVLRNQDAALHSLSKGGTAARPATPVRATQTVDGKLAMWAAQAPAKDAAAPTASADVSRVSNQTRADAVDSTRIPVGTATGAGRDVTEQRGGIPGCVCGTDTEGQSFCFDDLWCGELQVCRSSTGCPPGYRCLANNCCTAPEDYACFPECPDSLTCGEGEGGICETGYQQCSNDLCEDAQLVNVPSSSFGSTVLASLDNAPVCVESNDGPGVWYKVIGTGNTITASTCNEFTPNKDTKISVYCADCDTLSCVTGDDDSCTGYPSLLTTVSWCSQAGTEYLILVHDFSATSGSDRFTLDVWDDGVTCPDPETCTPCDVSCAGTPENEPDCGLPVDTVNGGCNSSPAVFSTISCGETVCGTAAFDDNLGTRDTDWYQITVTQQTEFTWTVNAEFAAVTGLVETDPLGSGDCADLTGALSPYVLGAPCEELSITVCLPPGTHTFFVAPDFTVPFLCNEGRTYEATLTCDTCTTGACCLSNARCEIVGANTCEAMGGTFHGLGTDCDPDCCQQPYTGADDCSSANVTPVPVDGTPVAISGDSANATGPDNCLGTVVWWEGFSIDECADVVVDYCCTDPLAWVVFVGLNDNCPVCSFLNVTDFAQGDGSWACEDGNLRALWEGLPAGTYHYPVYAEPGSNGPYQLHVTANPCTSGACCVDTVCRDDWGGATSRNHCADLGGTWYNARDCSQGFVCPGAAETICDDGVDNDGDLLIDCDDPDCTEDPACAGACCDDSTGVCNDAVAGINCTAPLRFVTQTLCADLDPPCGGPLGACCISGNCDNATETDCLSQSGIWLQGKDCANFACPELPTCPANTLYDQLPDMPPDPWTFGVSDADFADGNAVRYESFPAVGGPICDVHWWGITYDGPAVGQCIENPMTFNVKFYQDAAAAHLPGTEVCAYTATVTGTPTGWPYIFGPLIAYDLDLSPCCPISTGWVSIQATGGSPDCWFWWLSSPDGDGLSCLEVDAAMDCSDQDYDLSVCLTGAPIPLGACCVDGSCTGTVTEPACQEQVGTWFEGETCATVNCQPPTQACCVPGIECVDTPPDECRAGNGIPRGPGTNCEITPCPQSPQACCFAGVTCTEVLEGSCIPACQCNPDMNCDGALNASDIEPFKTAMTDPVTYQNQFPLCEIERADVDCDGDIDELDWHALHCLIGGGVSSECMTIDPASCTSHGGTPLAPTTVCANTQEACCSFSNGACLNRDPVCCEAAQGSVQGPGTVCGELAAACCLGGPACVMVDPLCCDDLNGVPSPIGEPVCRNDNDGNGVDDACEETVSCAPTADGSACETSAVCVDPNTRCQAKCMRYNPTTGVSTVIGCDCRSADECHVESTPSGGANPCVLPDNGTGTVTLPPIGCDYLSPDEVHEIIAGLPPGTTIELDAIHTQFICEPGAGARSPSGLPIQCETPGGNLGGHVDVFGSTLILQLRGTGALSGFSRNIQIPVNAEVHTGPRNPGDPVQDFPTDMFRLQGGVFGDPDFAQLNIVGGTGFELPSPGHTTLTRLPSGTFQVDSFFDITYQIDFVGAPGSVLQNLAGTTTATIRMQTGRGGPLDCVAGCASDMVCEKSQVTNADGTIDICCDCVPLPPGACCLDDGGCQDVTAEQCRQLPGVPLGPGSACQGDTDGNGVDDACDPNEPCDECGPGAHWIHSPACPPGSDNLPSGATVGIDLTLDCGVETSLRLHGPATIARSGPLDDSLHFPGTRPVDAHMDVIDTEIVSMTLTTADGLVMKAGAGAGVIPLPPSYGTIAEDPDDPLLADSFFEVFFELDAGGGLLLYNQTPLRVESKIDCVPPDTDYIHSTGCVELYTSPIPGQGEHVANLVAANHSTFLECGSDSAGDCFGVNGTPYCDDQGCCEQVCEIEPDCCGVTWDRTCVELAWENCPLPPVACCLDGGACADLPPTACRGQGGDPKGPGSACQGDANGNGVDDACDSNEPCDECGPGDHWMHTAPWCPPGADTLPSGARVGIDVDLDCIEDTSLRLHGPATIVRSGPRDDSVHYIGTRALDGHMDVIDTEMVSMTLTTLDGLTTMRAGAGAGVIPLLPTYGAIAEKRDDAALADSFFDVFFEIDDGAGLQLYNQTPLRVESEIDCIPPDTDYIHPTGCIALYTSPYPGQGQHIANLVTADHSTFPRRDFTYECVIVDSPSVLDRTRELPAGITDVPNGDTFYVEFWASDTGATNTGLVSVYADLDYPEQSVSTDAASITHTALFNLFPSGADTGTIIDELGGSQLAPAVGVEPEWAKVAYVRFTADQDTASAQFGLQPGTSESSAFNRGLVPPADIDYGSCSVAIRPTGCEMLVASRPPSCAIDARQPSQPDGSNAAGWQKIELVFDTSCDATSLAEEGFVIDVQLGGTPPTITNISATGNTVAIEFSPFIELTKWTCFGHTSTAGRVCLGYLPGNVNSDSTSSPAIDLSALIDCLNSPGTCQDWQQNINRDSTSNVADLTRLIDLFNGAAHYKNWTGALIDRCPTGPE